MSKERKEINLLKLLNHAKTYENTMFLIDEFPMVSKATVEAISSALIRVTKNNNSLFGGVQ